jgi:hypothetical protein
LVAKPSAREWLATPTWRAVRDDQYSDATANTLSRRQERLLLRETFVAGGS